MMAAKEISVKKYVVRLSGEERDRLCLLDAFVGGDAGADQRRGELRIESFRDVGDVIRIGDDVFSEAAIPGVTPEFCVGTDRLPGRQAMLAVTAGRVEPGHSD